MKPRTRRCCAKRPKPRLRALAGEHARLREDQWTAIEALVVERSRVLVVQRTGWGKSAVYFVATALLRELGEGPTVIVSPLLALMRNQIAAAERAGIQAVTINSANPEDVGGGLRPGRRRARSTCCWSAPSGSTTPTSATTCCPSWPRAPGWSWSTRRTASPTGATTSGPTTGGSRTLFDELPPGIPVLATTATANARVTRDVAEQLGRGARWSCAGALERESLHLSVVRLPTAPSSGWPGWPRRCASCPAPASSTR